MLKIGQNIHCLRGRPDTDRPVLSLLVGSRRSLLIDAGNSPRHAAELLDRLTDAGLPCPDLLALTHSHPDHVLGLSSFDAPVIAHERTRENIREMARQDWNDGPLEWRVQHGLEHPMTAHMLRCEHPGNRGGLSLPLPEIAFSRSLSVDLGGMRCLIEHLGGDHAPDSTLIHVPEARVLFLGDCLYLRTFTREVVSGLFDRLLGYDAEWFVDSHENEPLSRGELEKRRQSCLGKAAGEAARTARDPA